MKINREIEDVKKIYKAGLKEVAIASGELIALKYPENLEIKRILSKMYFLCGQLDKAIQKLEEIILISSIDGEALFNLSIIYSDKNNLQCAFKNLKKYTEINPFDYAGWLNLSELQIRMKDYGDSINSSLKVLKINPANPEAFNNIGVCMHHSKKYNDAINNFDRAIKLNSFFTDAYINKGNSLKELGEFEESLVNYDQAININQNKIDAWFNKGNVLRDLRQYENSIKCYDRAIEIKPNYFEAWLNKGATLDDLNRFAEALTHFDTAISIEPNSAKAWSNKAMTLSNLREVESSIRCYDRSLEINPSSDLIFGERLHAKMKICDWTAFNDSINFCEEKILESKLVIQPFGLLSLIDNPKLHKINSVLFNSLNKKFDKPVFKKNPTKKIKVGYYSADFHNHATSYLMAELFEQHDRNRFEIYGFSFGPDTHDEMRKRVSKSFLNFYQINNLSNKQIVSLSRDVGIDIAIDLKGYTQDGRWEIFSARCAPLQVSYLGYPGTMGADFIDYIVADKVVIPEELNDDYVEKIIYLPNCYQVNDSKRKIQKTKFSRVDFSLPENSFIFCCFNNTYKITPQIFEVWMRILRNVENSVLWLFEDNKLASKNLVFEAKKSGVDQNRIIFAKRLPNNLHIERQQLADLFLDTSPYNAHTTCSDALWSDLPVLTCPGKSFASRVAASLLRSLNLDELIVDSFDEYAAKAIFLANNPLYLEQIKNKLKINKLDSSLFNSKVFAQNIEKSYEAIYERHIKNLPPCDIHII